MNVDVALEKSTAAAAAAAVDTSRSDEVAGLKKVQKMIAVVVLNTGKLIVISRSWVRVQTETLLINPKLNL